MTQSVKSVYVKFRLDENNLQCELTAAMTGLNGNFTALLRTVIVTTDAIS